MGMLAPLVALAALAAAPPGASPQAWLRIDARTRTPADVDLAALRAEYVTAVNAGDLGRLAALYTQDALAAPADGVILRGPEEIGQHFRRAVSSRTRDASVTLSPQRFSVDERIASETGTFSESRTGDSPGTATGVYVTIYTRGSNGQWQIVMEIRTRGRDKAVVRW